VYDALLEGVVCYALLEGVVCDALLEGVVCDALLEGVVCDALSHCHISIQVECFSRTRGHKLQHNLHTHTRARARIVIFNSAKSQLPSWGNNYNNLTRLSFVEHRQEQEYCKHHPSAQRTLELV